ncbi:MAG TPA: glycosyltransferase family 9 protein [Flavisolibacter sp.]|nr:glycosyltransferase family 9 protein [Flavisolibacter sp.]
MRSDWFKCKHILCIRPDNLGDLLMSTPAIRALKETFQCKITVLTSSMAKPIVSMIPEIDDVIVFDLPWVKHKSQLSLEHFTYIIRELQYKQFDACVLFTVYSQNPLPTVMLAYSAGIPLRLAYCRENPYALLTNWMPDQEPYTYVQHQVRRDLDLVASVGASTRNELMSLDTSSCSANEVVQLLAHKGVDTQKPWLVLHTGVSEEKRKYPHQHWCKVGKLVIEALGYQVLLTGVMPEKAQTDVLSQEIGAGAFSLAGDLTLPQFALLIKQASLVVSVNTATIHIAAAVGTPVVVLYALTNPQHTPWKGKGKLLLYDVPQHLQSKNEVIRYVQDKMHPCVPEVPSPKKVVEAIQEVLSGKTDLLFPEVIPLRIPVNQDV